MPEPPDPSFPFRLAPMLSWQEFLDAARAPETIPDGGGRHGRTEWAGASWEEALQLAVDGWQVALREADVTVGELRERAGLGTSVTSLEPVWDVTGSEVDIGAYVAGEPECMVDSVPRRVSRRGKVVTFLIPAGYSHDTPHDSIRNRGLAMAALCTAIIEAGHSVEIWSANVKHVSEKKFRASAAVRVIASGEPLDIGRLIFAIAHPAMLRRLWFAVWDGRPVTVARMLKDDHYGTPVECLPTDLPAEVADPYVFPFLRAGDEQWRDLDTALAWCHGMFADLGLIQLGSAA